MEINLRQGRTIFNALASVKFLLSISLCNFMTATLSRSEFLRNAFRGWKSSMRPPWSDAEEKFLSTCTKCGDCLTACPEKIIDIDSNGFPEINFAKGECTFCGDCATSCDANAIKRNSDTPPWDFKASILDQCLSKRGVTCRVCGDRCDQRAIKFQLGLGGVADPIIDQVACTACGACFAPCPVEAIKFTKPHQVIGGHEINPDSMTSVAGENLQ